MVTESEPAPGANGPAPRGSLTRIHTFVLVGLAVGAVYLLAIMLWPFLPAIVISAVLAVLVFPAYRKVRARLRGKQLAPMFTTIIVFFLVLLPALGVSLLLLEELRAGIAWVSAGSTEILGPASWIREWLNRIAERLGLHPTDIGAAIARQAQQLATTFAGRTVSLLTGLGGGLLQAGIAIFTLFYLLRDGEALVAHLKWLIPLESALSDRLFRRANEIIHATVFGSLIVAFAQGTLGGLAFWALGIRAPVVWATIMGMLSLLPAIGPGFVWVPTSVLLLVSGHPIKALALLAFGTLVIATVDNVLRAILVSDRAELHPLVVFFSVLGGLFVFGAAGIFIGPVFFVLALTLIEMARLTMEPPASPASPAETAATVSRGLD
jgi:predicted PurR-regulated permease PerM